MKTTLADIALPQLDELIEKFEIVRERSHYEDLSDTARDDASEFLTACISAIHRLAGSRSTFAMQADELTKQFIPHNIELTLLPLRGVLKALRHAIAEGHLTNVQELIHGNLFADFLEMAEHLLSEGYKDPAAVLIGGVLEEHIRKLCDKNIIDTTYVDAKGAARPKNLEKMNVELSANEIYSKLDQKNVTAWLDLRNKAAHGLYSKYSAQQVELLLQSVRDFIVRHPA